MKLLDAWRLHQIRTWEKNGQIDKIQKFVDSREKLHDRWRAKLVEFSRFHSYHHPSYDKVLGRIAADSVLHAARAAILTMTPRTYIITDESHGRAMGRGGD